MKKLPWRILSGILLTCFLLPAQAEEGEPGPEDGHAALTREYQEAQRESSARYRQAVEEAKANGTPVPMFRRGAVELEFGPRFLDAAREREGTEEAVPFLLTAVNMGRSGAPEVAKEALAKIVARHAESPDLAGIAFTLMYGEHVFGRKWIDLATTRIAEVNPHPEVKAAFLYAGAFVVQRDPRATQAERQEAIADLRRAAELAPESGYGKRAKGTIFELQHLNIGDIAPEIEGEDLDGVPFKLSDYRGKVVVLDFWGDW